MSPLTLDHDWLLQNVDRLHVGLAGDATAIGSALAVCANRLRDQPGKSKIIVLLTDGANNAGKITPLRRGAGRRTRWASRFTPSAPARPTWPSSRCATRSGQRHLHHDPGRHRRRRAARRSPTSATGNSSARPTPTRWTTSTRRSTSSRRRKVATKHFEHATEYFPWALYPGLLLPRAGNRPGPHPLAEGAVNDLLGQTRSRLLRAGLAARRPARRHRRRAAGNRRAPPAPAGAAAFRRAASGRRAHRAASRPRGGCWKRLLLIGGVACVFIALARPHLFFRWQEEIRNGIDMLVAVDCSKSMLTQDVKPSRLERAKLAISDFADQLPDDRLGLIAFAGRRLPAGARSRSTTTRSRPPCATSTPTRFPRPGTDIATAIDEAVIALQEPGGQHEVPHSRHRRRGPRGPRPERGAGTRPRPA